MTALYGKLATLAIRCALQFFVDDQVWYAIAPEPVNMDALTGVYSITLIPSEPIGCAMPRFTIDSTTGTTLAVHCRDESGKYFPYNLLAE